jgi:hypothetical protein
MLNATLFCIPHMIQDFLKVVGNAMHAAGKYLGVFLYPNMDKAKHVATSIFPSCVWRAAVIF